MKLKDISDKRYFEEEFKEALKHVDMNRIESKPTKKALWFLSKLCRIRDGHKCTKCGMKEYQANGGSSLHCHHKKPKKTYPELCFDLDNCVTLCLHCHKEDHGTVNNEIWDIIDPEFV